MISPDLKRLLSYLRNYKLNTGLNFLFNLLFILFSLFSIATVIPFLNIIFYNNKTEEPIPVEYNSAHLKEYLSYKAASIVFLFPDKATALTSLCLLIVLVFLLKNIFRYVAIYNMSSIRNGIVRDIQTQLYNKILTLPLSFFSKERKGDLMMRMTTDVKEVEYGVLGVIEIISKDPLFIGIYLTTLFIISQKLTLFVLIMMGVMGFIVNRIGKSLKRQSKDGQEKMGFIVSMIDETISGIRVINAFNNKLFLSNKFNTYNEDYNKVMVKNLRRRELSSPLSEFLIICVISCVLWYGGSLVFKKDIAADVLIGYMMVFASLIEPFKRISNASYNIQKGLVSFERVKLILDAENDITEKKDAIELKSFNNNIEYENVSFAYNNFDGNDVLKNINLNIQKGKMVALVGLSGSGKSTLADLLCRFYDVSAGSIKIDGVDIRDYKLSDIRKFLSIVSQEPILFNDTIANNISFGLDNVSDADIELAAKVANAHDFICKLQNGYQTNIGDRGMTLSGGERQRITIARAVLRNPAILILDEATSSLDSESEKLVQDALIKLMRNRTSIVIAHRLSTIQYADEIIVMQDGIVVERGNHIGLLSKNGLYRKLVDLQAF
jgi:subfamily B ATP-binding cassette protein MsbA